MRLSKITRDKRYYQLLVVGECGLTQIAEERLIDPSAGRALVSGFVNPFRKLQLEKELQAA